MSAAFIYVPIAPHVPTTAGHTYQRYFIGNGAFFHGREIRVRATPSLETWQEAGLSVYRNAANDTADVTLSATFGNHLTETSLYKSETSVTFDPAELRTLAQRLLDAAHDIETNPAAMLMAQRQADEVPA